MSGLSEVYGRMADIEFDPIPSSFDATHADTITMRLVSLQEPTDVGVHEVTSIDDAGACTLGIGQRNPVLHEEVSAEKFWASLSKLKSTGYVSHVAINVRANGNPPELLICFHGSCVHGVAELLTDHEGTLEWELKGPDRDLTQHVATVLCQWALAGGAAKLSDKPSAAIRKMAEMRTRTGERINLNALVDRITSKPSQVNIETAEDTALLTRLEQRGWPTSFFKLYPFQAKQVRDMGRLEENSMYRGGLLAEEMGMGKTSVILARVVAVNEQNSQRLHPALSAGEGSVIRKVRANTTLYIVPPHLKKQVIDEARSRSGELLRPEVFDLNKHGTLFGGRQFITSRLATSHCGFLVATYVDMVKLWKNEKLERYDTSKPPEDEDAGNSPFNLFQHVCFTRVVLDEPQDADKEFLQRIAPKLTSLYRWCVSGTPFKDSITTISLLRFLLNPFAEPLWCATTRWLKGKGHVMNTAHAYLKDSLAGFSEAPTDARPKITMMESGELVVDVLMDYIALNCFKDCTIRYFPRATFSPDKLSLLNRKAEINVPEELPFRIQKPPRKKVWDSDDWLSSARPADQGASALSEVTIPRECALGADGERMIKAQLGLGVKLMKCQAESYRQYEEKGKSRQMLNCSLKMTSYDVDFDNEEDDDLWTYPPKIVAACRLVQRTIRDEPTAFVLVFVDLQPQAQLLKECLEAQSDGKIKVAKFGKGKAFNNKTLSNPPMEKVLIMHQPKMNSGLNLQIANHVVFLTPDPKMAKVDQAIGRVLRIGQRRDVHVWFMASITPIEQRVLLQYLQKMQSDKELSNRIEATDDPTDYNEKEGEEDDEMEMNDISSAAPAPDAEIGLVRACQKREGSVLVSIACLEEGEDLWKDYHEFNRTLTKLTQDAPQEVHKFTGKFGRQLTGMFYGSLKDGTPASAVGILVAQGKGGSQKFHTFHYKTSGKIKELTEGSTSKYIRDARLCARRCAFAHAALDDQLQLSQFQPEEPEVSQSISSGSSGSSGSLGSSSSGVADQGKRKAEADSDGPPPIKRVRSPFAPSYEFCADFQLTDDAFDTTGVIEEQLKELIIQPTGLNPQQRSIGHVYSGCAFNCKLRHGPNWHHYMYDEAFVLMQIHGPHQEAARMAKGAEMHLARKLQDDRIFNRHPLKTSSAEDVPVSFPDMIINTDEKDAGVGIRDHKKPCSECMALPGRDSFACYEIYLLVQYNKE